MFLYVYIYFISTYFTVLQYVQNQFSDDAIFIVNCPTTTT